MTRPSTKKRHKRNSLSAAYRKRDKALEHLVAMWTSYQTSTKDSDVAADLEAAMHAFTLADMNASYEFAFGVS